MFFIRIHIRQSIKAMSNDELSERGTESLAIQICGGAVCPYNNRECRVWSAQSQHSESSRVLHPRMATECFMPLLNYEL